MTHDAPSGSPLDSTQACTIVLRGASSHLLDEAERSLHDALCVLSQVRPDAGLNARTVRRSSAIQKLTPTRRARPSAFADRQGFEGRLRRGPHGDYDGEGTLNIHLQRLRSRTMATEGTDAPVTDRVGGCCRTYGIPPSGRRRAGAADAREEGPRHGGTRAKLCTESTSGADPMRAELHSLLWLLTAGFVRPSWQR